MVKKWRGKRGEREAKGGYIGRVIGHCRGVQNGGKEGVNNRGERQGGGNGGKE